MYFLFFYFYCSFIYLFHYLNISTRRRFLVYGTDTFATTRPIPQEEGEPHSPGEYMPMDVGPGEYMPMDVGPGEYMPMDVGPGEYMPMDVGPGEYMPDGDARDVCVPVTYPGEVA
jgi:hypothetical protein